MRNIATCGAILLALAAGCAAPNKQVALVEQDKQQLLATIKDQRDTIRTLRQQDASKETRLAEAEKELARLPGGTRISARPADSPPTKAEPLPWRSPPAKGGPPSKTADPPTKTSGAPPSLSALAAREGLQIDRQSGAARLDANVPFAEGQAVITADGKRQLDDVAKLLKSDDYRDLRIMVAGYAEGRPAAAPPAEGGEKFASSRDLAAARAQAVADYLDRHGIAQERLAVSGLGSRGPLGGPGADRLAAAGSVQIYLLQPGATVVGWGTSGEAVRR